MTRSENYAAVVAFHGHECPGAAVGLRMAEVALERYGRHATGNELIAVAETDTCAVDAVQVLTGCTAGKRNLRHEDNGKNAFSFWRQGAAEGVRLVARPGSDAFRDEETWSLADKVSGGEATGDERESFARRQRARIERILQAPAADLFTVTTLAIAAPAPEQVRRAEPCAKCGEPTSVLTLHDHRGEMLCPACHRAAHGGALPAEHAGDHRHPSLRGEGGHHHHHH